MDLSAVMSDWPATLRYTAFVLDTVVTNTSSPREGYYGEKKKMLQKTHQARQYQQRMNVPIRMNEQGRVYDAV